MRATQRQRRSHRHFAAALLFRTEPRSVRKPSNGFMTAARSWSQAVLRNQWQPPGEMPQPQPGGPAELPGGPSEQPPTRPEEAPATDPRPDELPPRESSLS
jgi:hypothetical protein